MCGGEPEFSWFSWDFIKHVWDGQWRVSEEPGQEHVAIMNLTHDMFLLNKVPLLKMNVEVKQVSRERYLELKPSISEYDLPFLTSADPAARAGNSIPGI
jgi:hypothetical protein